MSLNSGGTAEIEGMQRPAVSPDDGFSLVEVLVSLAVVGILAGSLTTAFVGSLRTTHHQGEQQTAARLALDGVEQARAVREGRRVLRRCPSGPAAAVRRRGHVGR